MNLARIENTKTDAVRMTVIRDLGREFAALISVSRAFTAEAATSFEPPISGSAFQLLQWLDSFGPAKASQIADALTMDRSVVSRLMKQLGQLGLVEVHSAKEDGRSVVCGLTRNGREKLAKATVHKGKLFEMRLREWPEADLRELTRLLRRINCRP